MKVYIVTHYIDCEYDNIEKVFSSREKAEEYQELMRERYKCPRYYTSRKGEKLYITEDFYVDEYEVESSADRPQGRWMDKIIPLSKANPYGGVIVGTECSVCGYDGEDEQFGKISRRIVERFNFCPDCGVKMKGADND